MYAPPPRQTAEVFARLPDELRKTGRGGEWFSHQPAMKQHHSVLEGPSFDGDGNLYCVDIPWGRIFKIDPKGNFSLFVEYEGEPNGLRIHRDGRIFVADHRRGILVIDPDTRKITPFLERVRLEHLKAVNDLYFGANGDLFFTDQGLTGLHDPSGRVFRVRADGQVDCLLDNVPSPNGLVLSLDEKVLFVAVTRANAIWRVPFSDDGSVAKVGNFIQMTGGGGPDGISMDTAGNLAVCQIGMGALWLFNPQGEPILRVDSPAGRQTTNVAFGGPDNRTAFITECEEGVILKAELPHPGKPMFSGV
ncbi:SMP-30/gluconolactonase/LRE family protein [Mesorhizobium sp. LHD-90]|uniref:SMP-30/gluconolactonase/LRE family protein n=1 Tax=Mesorhizobium sp. LHD-90 TaxID=3071414 RepID=UPI0027E123DF|nr:SMP-30/gluconolactonase/LRE family protein [Mesorhizobium sp. LHD-90]MDQ6436969.1 SMP-30/gluconolactonase/LRE family protein [Mesorhizobium sp. LHD-90]